MTTEAKEVITKLLGECERQLHENRQSQQSSITDTKQAGSAMTSRYDTFREEAEYRATAFGVQAGKYQAAIRMLNQLLQANPRTDEKIVAGSLVTVQSETGEIRQYMPVPDGGGFKAQDVLTVNMQSLVGKALMRKELGDEVTLLNGGKLTSYTITEVR